MVDIVLSPRVQLSVPRFTMHPAARINSTATQKRRLGPGILGGVNCPFFWLRSFSMGLYSLKGFVGSIAGEPNTSSTDSSGRLVDRSDISTVVEPRVPRSTPEAAMLALVYPERFSATQLYVFTHHVPYNMTSSLRYASSSEEQLWARMRLISASTSL
jgi:hypothetical protein